MTPVLEYSTVTSVIIDVDLMKRYFIKHYSIDYSIGLPVSHSVSHSRFFYIFTEDLYNVSSGINCTVSSSVLCLHFLPSSKYDTVNIGYSNALT